MKNILFIGAHFDDAELGCGGTMAKLVKNGKKVFKFTLTDNETDFKERKIAVSYDSSKNASKMASKALGVIEIENESPVPCSTLAYSKEIMQQVENIIYKYNIDTVFIHFAMDMNNDHVEANKICLTAARHCKNILEYVSNGYALEMNFTQSYFVDISDFVELKKKALSYYGPEHNRMNRLFEMNIERNHVWGYSNEVEYAEGFQVVKMLDEGISN